MPTATKSDWIFEVTDGLDRPGTKRGESDTLPGALAGAWALNRYTESPVNIIDNRDDKPRVIATLRVDWKDE